MGNRLSPEVLICTKRVSFEGGRPCEEAPAIEFPGVHYMDNREVRRCSRDARSLAVSLYSIDPEKRKRSNKLEIELRGLWASSTR